MSETIDINHVTVGTRARKDLGDLTDLMESIKAVGLLQPIVLDDRDRLIAGQRRLEACKKLGWPSVPYVVAKRVKDATQHLLAERDENTCRKAMTPTELKVLADAIKELHGPEAAERRLSNLKQAPKMPVGNVGSSGRVHVQAAEAVGVSGTQLARIDRVVNATEDEDPVVREVAQEAQKQMDAGELSVSAAERKVAQVKTKNVVSKLNRASRNEKAERMRPMAEQGMTSRQIAAEFGLGNRGFEMVREIAKEHGITIQADETTNRARNIDSNRVVNETVIGLSGYAMGLTLVDPDELDPTQLEGWLSSLKESLTAFTRLKNTLKEKSNA